MPNTADWNPGEVFHCLVYGRSKVFKTGGALTFPRPIVMDFDRGIAVSRHPKFVEQFGILNIEYEQFADVVGKGGVPKDHKAFDAACVYFDNQMKKSDQFDTWVIDSGTTLSRAALHKAVVLLGSDTFKAAKSKTHETAKQHGLLLPKLQDYGAERSMIEQFIDMLLKSGKNVVFICHQFELMDEEGGLLEIGPLLTGKSKMSIPLMFDEIYYVKSKRSGKEWRYLIQTEPDGICMAGSRLGIPNGLAWNWPSIKSALKDIRAQQHQQATEAKE